MSTYKLMIGGRQLQKFLQIKNVYKGAIDGEVGPKTQKAAVDCVIDYMDRYGLWTGAGPKNWHTARFLTAAIQVLFKELGLYDSPIDGLDGPATQAALESYQNLLRNKPYTAEDEQSQKSTKFPRYADMNDFYGPVGQNIERYKVPFRMRLAWDLPTTIDKMSLNKRCGESAIGVYESVRDHYSVSGIVELRLDLFGGSLNVRKMRGGENYSVHSWGAAIDTDPLRNQFRWNNLQATLDGPDYDFWWKAWEEAGWVSLGRERNFDWMHIQACRL